MSSVPQSALHWFEIPVADMDRAQRFYETLLTVPLQRQAVGPQTLAVLPYTRPGVGGGGACWPAPRPSLAPRGWWSIWMVARGSKKAWSA